MEETQQLSASQDQEQSAQPIFQTALYLGDLEHDVDENALFHHFSSFGFQLVSVRVCRDRDTQRSLGYGYANFPYFEEATRAMEVLNYVPMEGRKKPIRMTWKATNPFALKTNSATLFINHLEESITHRALYDIARAFGPVLSVKISSDAKGKSKGFGFVQFESKEASEIAKKALNGAVINEKEVLVEDFVPRTERPEVDPETTFTNLYVNFLPKDLDHKEFRQMFEAFGEVESILLQTDQEGVCQGFGYVNFKEHDSAVAAVERLHNREVFSVDRSDKPLYCQRFVSKSERVKKMKEERKTRPDRPVEFSLYVKNLHLSVDGEQLKEVFKEFGEVKSARVMVDERGQSKGMGHVSFTSIEAAEAAIHKMFGSVLKDRPMYVAHAQPADKTKQHREPRQTKRSGPRGGSSFLSKSLPVDSSSSADFPPLPKSGSKVDQKSGPAYRVVNPDQLAQQLPDNLHLSNSSPDSSL